MVSAHRTPDLLYQYASTAEDRGLNVSLRGRRAAHLPYDCIHDDTSCPWSTVNPTLNGVDSLLSIVQMPAGVPPQPCRR